MYFAPTELIQRYRAAMMPNFGFGWFGGMGAFPILAGMPFQMPSPSPWTKGVMPASQGMPMNASQGAAVPQNNEESIARLVNMGFRSPQEVSELLPRMFPNFKPVQPKWTRMGRI